MVTRADSAPPMARGAVAGGLWRIALVVGLTTAVVLVWALRGPAAPPAPQTTGTAETLAQPPIAESSAESARAALQPLAPPPAVADPLLEAAPAAWPQQSGIIPGRPDPALPLRPAAFERYVVQRGEALALIAALRGVTLADLLLFNPELGDGSVLVAGAAIWIPIWEAVEHDAP